jgi:hypothetical protein
VWYLQGAILGRKFRTDKKPMASRQTTVLFSVSLPPFAERERGGRCFERDLQKILVIMNILGAFEGASSSLVGGDSMSFFCNLPYQHTGTVLPSLTTHPHTRMCV